MLNSLSYTLLADIAKDLSSDEITFPTFLDITLKVREVLNDPNLSMAEIANLIGTEPLMSAKILSLANSVAYNPSGRSISDLKTAITMIGVDAVRTVSYAVAIKQLAQSKTMIIFKDICSTLWDHSVYVSALCRVLASRSPQVNADEAMFAGLTHDIGVFYLLSRISGIPELHNDKSVLYALLAGWHDNIGHMLLSAIGQSETILTAVQMHETTREPNDVWDLSDVLYIANMVANCSFTWRDPAFSIPEISKIEEIIEEEVLAEITDASLAEVQSIKAALGA